MSSIYLFNKQLGQLQEYSTEELIYVPNDVVDNIMKAHKEDLEKNYGKISLNEKGDIFYEPYMTKMLVHKDFYYFTEIPIGSNVDASEDFDIVELTVKDYREHDNIRASITDGSTQVMYFDNKFQVVKVPVGMTFDFKTKKVVRDVTTEMNRLMMDFTKENVSYNIKYNGFPFEINGNKYLQPFRGYEDRSYYIDMRNNVTPENRQVKFYKDNNGLRDSGVYDLIIGNTLSDEFLDGMIVKIISYENSLRPAVEKFFEKVDVLVKEKKIDDLIEMYNNQHKIVLGILEDIREKL